MHIVQFTFNPFSENTYIVYDETKECLIIDPGNSDQTEDDVLFDFISDEKLVPTKVLNTHCHIDHILGNAVVCEKYKIPLCAHHLELPMLERAPAASLMWNVHYRISPIPSQFINENDNIEFGQTKLRILFVSGHSPGHIAFVNDAEKIIISGDVLFRESVGRVDLPMCNANDLVHSIQQKMYALPADYTVYSGHGPATTIGWEIENNSFVRANWQGLV